MMGVGGIEMQVRLIAALNYLDTPEAVDSLSIYSKNLVDTLMKKGFDREHAIRILAVIGVPQTPSN